jgi:sugar phosphate isomerase/epimerase
MKIDQVAAQLYTIRSHLKTVKDASESLKKVRKIGYRAVQVSGVGPDVPDTELASMCKNEGLTICATHERSDVILNNPMAVAERLHLFDCKYTAYPHPSNVDMNNSESVMGLIKGLNESGRILRGEGITLAYHNHQCEFIKLNGKIILDLIYDKTDANYLQGEIDTYWVQCGGGNPAEWCRKLKKRLPLLHLKDYGITADNNRTFAEIGYGNLNWPEIIREAERSGCQWFIVEQDECPADPFDSLKKSFDYIGDKLCK